MMSLGALTPPWARALCPKCGSLWERPGPDNARRFATACCSGPAALRLAAELETETLSQRLVAARDAWVARRCASCRPVYDPETHVSAAALRLAETCQCLRVEDEMLAAEQQQKHEAYTRERERYLSRVKARAADRVYDRQPDPGTPPSKDFSVYGFGEFTSLGPRE